MIYTKYQLDWQGSEGKQPYQDIASACSSFLGGEIVNNGIYFGYIFGGDEAGAFNTYKDKYQFEQLTPEQATTYWETIVPAGTVVDMMGEQYTLGNAVISQDGFISQPRQ